MATNTLKEMLTELKTICSRCILCYTTANPCYKTFAEQVDINEKHCSSCLGILEQDQILNVVDKVATKLNKENYTTDSFALALAFPQCLVLRKRALLAHIKESNFFNTELHTTKCNDLMNPKEAYKLSIIKMLEQVTKKKYNIKSPLLVKVQFTYFKEDEEIKRLEPLLPKPSQKRRFQKKHNTNQKSPLNNIQLITETVNKLPDSKVVQYTSVPPERAEKPCDINISFVHEPIYIAGRYNKYSRELSQTPWLIDGERKTESSVQELICDSLVKATGASEVKFMSSGREDCDVRMLGKGRPFVAGLVNPKTTNLPADEVRSLEREINQSTELVGVRDLQVTDKESLVILKAGENEKKKCYSAKIWCPEPIDNELLDRINTTKDLKIGQKTPLRVLHRRPLCVRERTIYSMNIQRINKEEDTTHHYQLQLKTEAGTYIKEFVHGDLGRTIPSMCTLMGAPFDILELDVDEVQLDWPPKIEST